MCVWFGCWLWCVFLLVEDTIFRWQILHYISIQAHNILIACIFYILSANYTELCLFWVVYKSWNFDNRRDCMYLFENNDHCIIASRLVKEMMTCWIVKGTKKNIQNQTFPTCIITHLGIRCCVASSMIRGRNQLLSYVSQTAYNRPTHRNERLSIEK